jgi:hypothetical protein
MWTREVSSIFEESDVFAMLNTQVGHCRYLCTAHWIHIVVISSRTPIHCYYLRNRTLISADVLTTPDSMISSLGPYVSDDRPGRLPVGSPVPNSAPTPQAPPTHTIVCEPRSSYLSFSPSQLQWLRSFRDLCFHLRFCTSTPSGPTELKVA